jgi:branched-chain amino acid transport system substrate-binding protein
VPADRRQDKKSRAQCGKGNEEETMNRQFRNALRGVVAAGFMLAAASAVRAEPGVTDDMIVIGAHGPITGGATFLGLGGKAGAELAFKEINDAGGINGRKIKLIYEDDGFSPSRALAAVKKLIEQDQVFMIDNISGSNPTVGTAEYLRQAKVPVYVTIASAPAVTHPFNRYLFRGATSETVRYGELDAEFFVDFLGVKRIAILSGLEENLRTEADEAVKMLDKWYGVKPLMRAEFKVGDKDFTPQLLQVKQANPDFIFAVGQVPEASIIVRQARELGLKQPIMVAPSSVDNTLITNLGTNAEGVLGLWGAGAFLDSGNPDMIKFREAWAKMNPNAPKGRPNLFDVWGYTEGYVIAEALKRAGRDLTREKFIDALESIQDYRVSEIATPRTFTKWHHIGNLTQQAMVVVGQHWLPLRWDPRRQSEVLDDYKK